MHFKPTYSLFKFAFVTDLQTFLTMLYIWQVLGLLVLTIAAPVPVPGHQQVRDLTLPVWPLSMALSVEDDPQIYGIIIQITLDAA